uniref:Uncharacterized protein n=1 Tax=Terrapene triunguis TaxID=2587831 RepID=A0A674HZB5_9SAUR
SPGRRREDCQRGFSPAPARAPPPPRVSPPGLGQTMASSEEDGAGSGSLEEKEKGRKRRLGALATAWLIGYNIAMTAGCVLSQECRAGLPGQGAPLGVSHCGRPCTLSRLRAETGGTSWRGSSPRPLGLPALELPAADGSPVARSPL